MSGQVRSVKNELLKLAIRQSRHLLWFAFIFSVFVNVLMLVGPLFMLQVYDRVLGSRSEETLVALLILVVALYGLMWLLDFARTRLLARYGARFQTRLDDVVFKAQLTTRQGRDGPSATRDLEQLQSFFASPALVAVMDVPFTPIFVAVIFVFHSWLGWFAIAGSATLILIALLSQLLTSRQVVEAQRNAENAHGFATNARLSAELIRSQGMLEPVTERWMAQRGKALRKNMTAVDRIGAFSTFTRAFRLALQSLILALGAWLVLQGELTPGAMIAGSILLGRALAPVEQLIARWPQIAQARKGWLALRTLLEETPPEVSRLHLPRPRGQLDVKGVTISSNVRREPILYDVSFSVEPGKALGVVGRSGSGKTTIAKTLLGLIEPSIGEVRLDGALITQYGPKDLGAHIGYLPQDPMLINGTIAENIARMSLEPNSELVVAAAVKAKAHDMILALPDGYDTVIENNRVPLSGGQRQRIALARALYGEPVLLVLDEPNSALDQAGSEALNSAIRHMKDKGCSVVIMTHRPVAISECDTLLVLDKGRRVALGPRDEIIRSMMKNATDLQRHLASGDGI